MGGLGAGVVGGDDDEVRQVRRNLAHEGPLGPVPVPAAPEEGHHPPPGEAPQGGEHIGQGVGGVGVVDEHGVVPGCGHYLHPALDVGAVAEDAGALPQGDAQGLGRR